MAHWFADRLGQIPEGDLKEIAKHREREVAEGRQRLAELDREALGAGKAQPTPAPQPEKKKKGWF